jgi:hypothetical protein
VTLAAPREGGCHRAPRRSRHGGARAIRGTRGTRGTSNPAAAEVVRWGSFCCALVPVVLLVCGSSAAGALGTAAGLAAVTVACRMLLRRADRSPGPRTVPAGRHPLSGPALPPAAARPRHGKAYTGAHRSTVGPHRGAPGHRRASRG